MRHRSSLTLLFILATCLPASAAVTWSVIETGSTDPFNNGNWPQGTDDGDGGYNASTITENMPGSTPLGDNVFMNLNVGGSTKIKLRRQPSGFFNGTGMTCRFVMRMVSGGSLGNWGVESQETAVGRLLVGFQKNPGDNGGIVRLSNGTAGPHAEFTVGNITIWHVYWIVISNNGNAYVWIDPDSSDTSYASADLTKPNGAVTGDRVNWGDESGTLTLNEDIDDLRFAVGPHFPSEEPVVVLPTSTPTPNFTATPTPTPTVTPTPTNTPNNPTIELSMARQVGCYENLNCSSVGLTSLYIHLSDSNGNRLSGAQCYIRVNGGSETSIGSTGSSDVITPDFLQYAAFAGSVDYYEVRVQYNSVSSTYSPILYRDVAPYNNQYSWELNYVYNHDTVTRPNNIVFTSTVRDYDYAHAQLNTPLGIVNGSPTFHYQSDQFQIIGTAAGSYYAQTFIPTGNRVIAAKAFCTTEFLSTVQYSATIHQGSPAGPQIGGAVLSPSYLSVDYPKISVFWPIEGANSVPVTPGQTYAIKFTKVPGGTPGTFSVHHHNTDNYASGQMYRDGTAMVPATDIMGVVITAQATPSGAPTATPTLPPASGVGPAWNGYR